MAQIRTAKCPLCGKKATIQTAPFCSHRCAMLDLGQWLGEGYRIPDESAPLPSRGGEDE